MELFDEIDEHAIDWLLELNEIYESMQDLLKNGLKNGVNNKLEVDEEKEHEEKEENSFFLILNKM